MTKILLIAGKKRSGKNSVFNYLSYLELINKQVMIDNELRVMDTLYLDPKDGQLKLKLDYGDYEFNLENPDDNLKSFLNLYLYPEYKNYAFAYKLKKMMTDLYGISPELVYGTDSQKERQTKIHWSKVSLEAARAYGFPKKADIPDRYMTVREFAQVLGTQYVRCFKEDAFIEQTLKAIEKDSPKRAVITDGRFENELKAVKKMGGKVIYLTRQVSTDSHSSENEINPEKCRYIDKVIDNHNMTMAEKNWELFKTLQRWNFLPEEFNAAKFNLEMMTR